MPTIPVLKTAKKYVKNTMRVFTLTSTPRSHLVRNINRHAEGKKMHTRTEPQDFTDARFYQHFSGPEARFSSRNSF